MPTENEHEHSVEHIHNPDVGHETSDVNVRGIAGFGAGLALCTVLVCLVLYGMFVLLRKGFTGTPVNVNALTGTREPLPPSAEAAAKIFPEPRLQVDYYSDLDEVRADWDEHLNTYGWLDKNAGVVHIPIDKAMQLVLQRGLPVRSSQPQTFAKAPGHKPAKPGAGSAGK
jgi:hypothetical protein